MNSDNVAIDLFNTGNLYYQQKNYSMAVDSYKSALALTDKYYQISLNCGSCLIAMGFFDEAILMLKLSESQENDNFLIMFNLGLAYKNLKDYTQAAAYFEKSLTLNETYENSYIELFNMFYISGDVEKSLKVAKRYENKLPNSYGSKVCLAMYYFSVNEFDISIKYYDLAIEIDKLNKVALYNKSFPLLAKGNYIEGFKLFEYRKFDNLKYPYGGIEPKISNLDDLLQKDVFIRVEGGFGDFIQMTRYFPMLFKIAKSLVVQVKPPLLEFCIQIFPNIKFTTDQKSDINAVCIDLMSLPYIFQTTIHSIPPVTNIKKEIFNSYPKEFNKSKKIGLCFKGSNIDQNMNDRDVPPEILEKIFEINVDFVILDYNHHEVYDQLSKKYTNITYVNRMFDNFKQLSGIICQLDLIVSIDTAIAHLAATLQAPTIILLKYGYDWRWGHCQKQCLWYPKVYRISQDQNGNWDSVVKKLSYQLKTIFGVYNGSY